MPTYTFRLPAAFSSTPVTVYNSADVQQTTGTTDANATFTATLPTGDYYAKVSYGYTSYRAAGEVNRGDLDNVSESGLATVFAPLSALAPTSRFPDPAMTFWTTFQTGHGWTLGAGGATDTTDFEFGTQSMKLTTTGTGSNSQSVSRNGLPAVDLSNRMIGVRVKVNDNTKLLYMQVYVGSNAMANAYVCQPTIGFGTGTASTVFQMHDDEWTWVYFRPDDYVVAGTGPTMTAVTDLKISFGESSGSTAGSPLVAHVGAIAHFPRQTPFPNGVVTFSCDDDYGSQWTLMRQALDKYGYGAQCNIIREGIDQPGNLTTDQLHALEDAHGWEVSGHSYTIANHNIGYKNLPADVMLTDAGNLKAWLRSEAFKGADNFAWPLGAEDTAAAKRLAKYFGSARHVDGLTPAPLYQPNRFRTAAVTITATTTVASITAKIDNAFTYGKWLQLVFHDIRSSGSTGALQYDVANFQAVVDYCATKGIPVRTVGQVMRAMNGTAAG